MSGGFFNYDQSRIRNIIDSIEDLIENNGRPKTEQELRDSSWGYINYKEYYEKYPEERFWHKYPDEVIEEFKKGLTYLKISYVYAQRIDWFVSGDDGKESFLKRLEKELSNIEKTDKDD
jgi:hypothetical protein